jgi:hypothetical protein
VNIYTCLDLKGKKTILNIQANENLEAKENKGRSKSWQPPVEGWLKVNVDGSYIAAARRVL